MLLNARGVLPGYSKHSDSGISQPHRMQTFDVSTNILDSQLSFFQRGRAGLRTQAPPEQAEPSLAAVPTHSLSANPAVRALPMCVLRMKRNDRYILAVTQVVALGVLIVIVALKTKVWYKMFAAAGLCAVPLLVTKAEACSLLPLLLLLHDVCCVLLML